MLGVRVKMSSAVSSLEGCCFGNLWELEIVVGSAIGWSNATTEPPTKTVANREIHTLARALTRSPNCSTGFSPLGRANNRSNQAPQAEPGGVMWGEWKTNSGEVV